VNKHARKAAKAVLSVDLTQDELTQEQEENAGEQWSRRGSSNEQDAVLRNDLKAIFASKGMATNVKRHECVEAFGKGHAPVLPTISYSQFNGFMEGTRKSTKPLNKNHRRLLEAFRDHELTSETSTDTNMDIVEV